jgi:hypothetical protein
MKRSNWRKKLTKKEAWQLKRYDQQIATQIGAVAAHPRNRELAATLALLKHERYLLQSKAAARLKRERQGCKSRWPLSSGATL